MRAALDTNMLVYAEGVGDSKRVSTSRELLDGCFRGGDHDPDAWRGAMDLCVTHQLSSWDTLVLNVAAQSGARLLLTEDMHPGLCWRGVRVVNPYSQEPDPLLAQLLS